MTLLKAGDAEPGLAVTQEMQQTAEHIEREPTIPSLLAHQVRVSPQAAAFRQFDPVTGDWRGISWSDLDLRLKRWRGAFLRDGLGPGDRVAVLLQNCIEWVLFDLASLSLGLVSVPLYQNDSSANHARFLRDAEPQLVLVETVAQWRAIQAAPPDLAFVRTVLALHHDGEAANDVVPLGQWLDGAPEAGPREVDPNALATIVYTSGTTGQPKGVMLSHCNLVYGTLPCLERIPALPDDIFLAFLPFAHIFARTLNYYLPLAAGCEVVFARSIESLPDDLRTVRPTIIFGVPRVYEKASSAIESAAAGSWLRRQLLRWTAALGWRAFEHRTGKRRSRPAFERLAHAILDWLVARRVRARFGGRVRVAVSGGAPLSRRVAKHLVSLGLPLLEGYGLAEASGAVTGPRLDGYVLGSVGMALPGLEISLAGDGELLVRGPSVMLGYWRDEVRTQEVVDPEGWLHTGDLAEIVDGHVFIRGRLHDVIVTATGEKIAPSDVETRITALPMFDQAIVIGNRRSFLIAIVVLNEAQWDGFARARHRPDIAAGEPNGTAAETSLLRQIETVTTDLPRYAQVRRLIVTLEPWTVENGLVTVTMKPKRAVIERRFQNQIDRVYETH